MAAIHAYPQSHLRQRNSPFASHDKHHISSISRPLPRQDLVSDSDSDDEPPPALKFSKVTEALLNDRLLPSSPIKPSTTRPVQRNLRAATAFGETLATPDKQSGIKILRRSSPSALGTGEKRGSTPPRIVHVGSGQKGSARRTISIAGPYPHRSASRADNGVINADNIITPAPASRLLGSVRPRAGSNSSQEPQRAELSSSSRPGSRNGQHGSAEQLNAHALATNRITSASHASDAVSRLTTSSISRTRSQAAEGALPTGSQRVKRAIATGTFLRSGPVRRGFRRRESEEDVLPADAVSSAAQSHPSSQGTPQHGSDEFRSGSTRATSVEPAQDLLTRAVEGSASRPSSRQGHAPVSRARADVEVRPASRQADSKFNLSSHDSQQRSSLDRGWHSSQPLAEPRLKQDESVDHISSMQRLRQQSYRYVSEAQDDQENAPPPTFKRNKEQELRHLVRTAPILDHKIDHVSSQSPAPVQVPLVERRPLNAISHNTPHRAAPPPPPKMSVLETATATVGSSTTKSRKKRTHIVINGKIFTQMGRIGKGGSSEVFLVMAENYKTFALKKVRLDNCDESAVRGFKGEIDLLKKLTEVDRVIRLYDWELNEEKQELLVLMEKGDTDLYRIMTVKNGGHDGKFDLTFTRYYWKEMLECVQAVHDHDIVHSDLKPANFLVVQGRLKLIDFGIANAIEVDHTCNVHRESHVGTPNYMSPESINDTSGAGRDAQGRPLRKDMKIGKSSDVWSLGCILYQMTYGRPPFAHIPTIPRIMAITNPKHIIDFPETGIGGVAVPSTLRGVLKRCLQREADLRPTIPQLLSETNEFLHREANGAVLMRQDVLEHIINKVVERCRDTKRGMPTPSEVAQYAPDFMAKIRLMHERV